MASQRDFFRGIQDRLRSYKLEELTPEARIDHRILADMASLNLLELDTIQNYRHNPTVYVEQIGEALFTPYVLEYAAKPDRYRAIVARMKKIPAYLRRAGQPGGCAGDLTTVAGQENEGNIDLIDKTMRASAPVEMRSEYDAAAPAAIEALKKFNEWLKSDLSKRGSYSEAG